MTDEELAAAIAAGLCKTFEGVYLTPYLCPAGIPTIGVGATYYENGVKVTLKDPTITTERALSLLMWHIQSVYLPKVRKLCPNVTNPQQLAALVDFAFNLGWSALQHSTMRQYVLRGNWAMARRECLKWVNAAGRTMKGLVRRRGAECLLM